MIDDYPNLKAILNGTVSGRCQEWPAIRRELQSLVDEPHWIEDSDYRPQSGKRVIFRWINELGKSRTSIGFYAAPKEISANDYEDPQEYEYDEAKDCYWLGTGWYEEGAEGEYFYPQYGVTHWMPLPAPPVAESI